MKQQFLAPVAGTARIAAVGLLICCAIPAVAQPQWGEPVQITKGTEVSTVQFLQNGVLLIAAGDSVHLINPDGTGLHTLFEREGIRRANMDPDGQIVVLDNDLDIFVANRDGSDMRPVASDPNLFEFAISFTPDGKNITFVTIDDVQRVYGIWIMSPNGRNKRKLRTETDMAFRHPRQSPDGSKISYFSVGKGVKPQIWVMDSDGSDSIALTNPDEDGISRQASWRFDGRKIVYASRKLGDFDIWTMNADGSDKRRITGLQGDEAKPVWGPDGTSIAFICADCGGTVGSDLYIVSRK
ncbi:MAG: hypothetical protein V3R30_03525 [Kiloniellales bacterium]